MVEVMSLSPMNAKERELAAAFDKAMLTMLEIAVEALGPHEGPQFIENLLIGQAVNLACVGYPTRAHARQYLMKLVNFRFEQMPEKSVTAQPEGRA